MDQARTHTDHGNEISGRLYLYRFISDYMVNEEENEKVTEHKKAREKRNENTGMEKPPQQRQIQNVLAMHGNLQLIQLTYSV